MSESGPNLERYTSEDFERGTANSDYACPKCGKEDVKRNYDIGSILSALFDVRAPWTPQYECRRCKTCSDDCFIATAVYAAPQTLATLREFRDTKLAKTIAGRELIRAYNLLGPQLARIVRHSPGLQKITKNIIDYVCT